MLLYLILLLSIIWLVLLMMKTHGVEHLPGPPTLPFVGNLHQIKTGTVHKQVLSWAQQYGDVYKIVLGSTPVVVLTGIKAMHEALILRGRDFKGRPFLFRLKLFSDFKDVVFTSDNPAWQYQKKMMSLQLKGYGAGLIRIEAITKQVLEKFMGKLETNIPLKFHQFVEKCACHITYIATFEKELADIEEEKAIVSLVDAAVDGLSPDLLGQSLDRFPWLSYFGHPTYRLFRQYTTKLSTLYNDLWKKRELIHLQDQTINSGNLAFKLLKYMDGENASNIDDGHIKMTLFQMFGAGLSTTTETLTSFFNIIVHYPYVQNRIQDEIDSVIGSNQVKIDDRVKMPYTQATILELNRFVSIVAFLIPHKTTCDTEIEGHKIPANTEVWLNNWGQNHDDRVWDEPYKFRPERFLNEQGHLVLADHPHRVNMMPFGAGPRVCVGETFAMSRMFLIITLLLQKFNFLPASMNILSTRAPSLILPIVRIGIFMFI